MKKHRFLFLWFLLVLFSPALMAGETLRILAWPGYVSREAIKAFEARHNVSVEVSVVNNDDDLWSRASSRDGSNYDLLAVNTAELRRYIDAGLVSPINLKQIPNRQKQTARFRKLDAIPGITHQSHPYAIPYTYSAMGLIYNRKIIHKAPTSMDAMWDPRYRGKVLAYNGSAHNFSLTALLLGIGNPFKLDDGQFIDVVNQLRTLRYNVLKFYDTPEEVVQLYRDHEIALIYANYGDQQIQALQKTGADIGYVIPKEGALAWLDCWAITAKTPNKALAEAWINHMLTPAVSGQLTREQGLANTLRDTPKPSMPDTGKLVWLQPVEDAKKRSELWERLLAGKPNKR